MFKRILSTALAAGSAGGLGMPSRRRVAASGALVGKPDLVVGLRHGHGAPLSVGDNSVPPELMTEFAAASLAATGLFWIALGVISGLVYRRLSLFSPLRNIY